MRQAWRRRCIYLSAAIWSGEHGGFVAGTALSVEAKGYLDGAGVYQVSKIERKA